MARSSIPWLDNAIDMFPTNHVEIPRPTTSRPLGLDQAVPPTAFGKAVDHFGGPLSVAAIIGKEIFAGINRKKSAKRQRKAALFTGQSLLGQATDIETVSGLDELEFREQSARELSSIESLFADAGIAPTGSALEVLMASKRQLETDALKIRETGRKQAFVARQQADQAFKQADYARDAAKNSFFGFA